VSIESARPAEFRAAFTGCRLTCIDTLAYYASLKFDDRCQNMHLQATGRVTFARVDSLGRGDKCSAVGFKLTNELCEMLQAAPKPIEFVNCQDIYAALPHFCHQSIQIFAAEACSARFVQVFGDFRFRPASAHVSADLSKLTGVTLRVS
jgi:hypothetical protein